MNFLDAPTLQVHRRQYVLGPDPWAPRDDWRVIALGAVRLSVCPELRLEQIVDAEGRLWVLLGLALQTAPGAPDPAQQIAAAPTAGVPDLRHDWAGRWLLLSEHALYTDMSAQIGCLFTRDHEGRPWMSSSPVLLRAICGNAWQSVRPSYQCGAEFFPVPSCSLVGASRLMPSQILDPTTGETSDTKLLPAIPADRDDDGLLDEIAARMRTAFERLPDEGKPLWLGLSSGGDSRVVFAAALASGRDVCPFTWVTGRTLLCDCRLGPKIAQAAGVEHTEIHAGPIDRARMRLVVEHAGPRLSTGDAIPLLRGARLGLTGFCTGGQCLDAWKSSKEVRFTGDLGDIQRSAAIMARVYFERPRSFFAKQYARWLEHVARTPVEGLNYQSRWPIEQSATGWQAPKEQLYDMQTLERFSVANAGTLTALMMALDHDKRRERAFEIPLIERLAPAIASFPRTPSDAELVGPVRARVAALANPSERVRQLRVRAKRARKLAMIRFDEIRTRGA